MSVTEDSNASDKASNVHSAEWLEQNLSQAITFQQAGKVSEAKQLYLKIIQAFPEQSNANHNLGLILLDEQDFDASLSLFRTALEAASGESLCWTSYIEALILAGQYEEANLVMSYGLDSGLAGDKVELLKQQLSVLESKQQSPQPVIAKKNGKPSASEMSALISVFNSGNSFESECLAIEMTQRYPDHGLGWKVLGAMRQQQGLNHGALQALKKAAETLPKDSEAQYNLGNCFYDLHRLDEAVACYKKAIKLDSGFSQAHYNLGNVLKHQGHLAQAEASYKKALKINSNSAQIFCNLAQVQYEQGRLPDAQSSYERALAIQADFSAAHNGLGAVLKSLGKLDEAEACFKRALAANSANVDVYNNLSALYQESGRFSDAEQCYKTLLTITPDSADAHNKLGLLFKEMGRGEGAIACYLKALAISPLREDIHTNLGLVFSEYGRFADAEYCYLKAIEISPNYWQAHNNYGLMLYSAGRFSESEVAMNKAIELNSMQALLYSNLSLSLAAQGFIVKAEASLKKAIELDPSYVSAYINLCANYLAQGRALEAESVCFQALKVQPDSTMAKSNLLFTMNYSGSHSVEYRLEQARQYNDIVVEKAKDAFKSWQHSSPSQRLRVGLISGDLRQHPVAFFLESWAQHVDSTRIELFVYSTDVREDAFTARLKPHFSSWKSLAVLTDQAAAKLIHDDGLHLLMDLSGHTAGNRLPILAWKPAPVQVSWLGYFATTGMSAVDYFIADEVGVPVQNQAQFVEKIQYLPDTRLCFTAPDTPVAVSDLPALVNGYVTFGSFQTMVKAGDDVLSLWAEVLRAQPNSKLRWQCKSFADPVVADDLRRRFAQYDIHSDRLILLSSVSRDAYLAAHAEVDFLLDTFPFPGGTTTCEALWMGVPTLTMAGDTLIARQGASIMTAAGLGDWIAESQAEYVAKALAYSRDLAQLAKLRSQLRAQVLASPLFDASRFARNMEIALWEMWNESQHEGDGMLSIDVESQAAVHGDDEGAASINIEIASDAKLPERDCDLQQVISDVLQIALEHQEAGRLDLAVTFYLEVLRIQPEHAEANYNLGIIEIGVKGIVEALPRFEMAVQTKPEHEQYWVSYINALMQAGAIDAAADALVLGQRFGLRSEVAQRLAAEFVKDVESRVDSSPTLDIRPQGKSNTQFFIKPKIENSMKFVIVAPYYSSKSAGIVVLHELCDSLNKLGHSAAMVLTGSGKHTISNDASLYGPGLQWYSLKDVKEFNEFIQEGVVIYPEIVTGNPLCARRVVRYVLNSEGFVAKNKMEASDDDFILAFSKLYHKSPHAYLMKLSLNPLFNSDNTVEALDRSLDLTYIGKGSNYSQCFVVPNTLEITRGWPSTKTELAELFKKSRFLYTWDVLSQTNADAIFCGTIPVFLSSLPLASLDDLNMSELGIYPMATATINGDNLKVVIPADFSLNLINFKRNYMELVNSYDSRLLGVIEQISQHFY